MLGRDRAWGGVTCAGSREAGGGDSAPPPRTCEPALRPKGVSRPGPAPSAKLSLPLAAARQALSYWPPPAPAIADVREAARAPPPAGRRSRDGGWRPRVTWRRCHPVSPQRHPVLPVPSPRHPPVSPPGVTALSPHCHPTVSQCHPDVTRCLPSCHPVSPSVTPPCPAVTLMSPTVTPPVTLSRPGVT